VFLLEPDMLLFIPKGCAHNFTKLSVEDIRYLVKLMESWSEWEDICHGVERQMRGVHQHLLRLNELAKGKTEMFAQNFGSVALDW